MPRKPRIHVPGGFYHVIVRGNSQQAVFFRTRDRWRFCELLEEGIKRFGHRVHAFCLMENHVHLLVQIGDIPLSRIMQNISFRYTAWINALCGRSGHLFQGRYRAILVDADTYLLELVRYIHLNPVRSGLVENPCDYRWSSHPVYIGRRQCSWLTTECILGMFAETVGDARAAYKSFISSYADLEHKAEFHGTGMKDNRVLGDATFLSDVMKSVDAHTDRVATIDDIMKAVCAHYGLALKDISSRSRGKRECEARALVALLVREAQSLLLTDLADRLNRDVSTLSEAAHRLDQLLDSDSELANRLVQVKSILSEFPSSQA